MSVGWVHSQIRPADSVLSMALPFVPAAPRPHGAQARPPTTALASPPPPGSTTPRTAPRTLPLSPPAPRVACAATGQTCSPPIRAPRRIPPGSDPLARTARPVPPLDGGAPHPAPRTASSPPPRWGLRVNQTALLIGRTASSGRLRRSRAVLKICFMIPNRKLTISRILRPILTTNWPARIVVLAILYRTDLASTEISRRAIHFEFLHLTN